MAVFGLFSASPGAGAPPRRSWASRLRLGGAPALGEAENGQSFFQKGGGGAYAFGRLGPMDLVTQVPAAQFLAAASRRAGSPAGRQLGAPSL